MSNSSLYRQPNFLGAEHEPVHRIRCPIHGFIRFSKVERSIIDHRCFRRLRYIKQLALTELVYPGATHSRFEHSIGVMEVATNIFDRLAADKGAFMEKMFRDVELLKIDPMARARQILRLAALLHDTGHCCFSHAAEPVIHKDSSHEALSVAILTEKELMGDLLESKYFEGCGKLVASLITPDVFPAPQLQLLRDIVSGHVDADRSDYLLRDSYHCGVDYGKFDHLRLIECLTCCPDEDSGGLIMAINKDGVHNFEALILARYQMSTQVYYHRLRRVYDHYLERYFESLDSTDFDSAEKILAWNDVKASAQMFRDAEDTTAAGHRWARRIVYRQHHKDVFSIDENAGMTSVKKAIKVGKQIKKEFDSIDFVIDIPERPFSIHKIARDQEGDDNLDDFPMIDRDKRTSLGERSQIIKNLSKTFRVGYIFADAPDSEIRATIENRCQDLYATL